MSTIKKKAFDNFRTLYSKFQKTEEEKKITTPEKTQQGTTVTNKRGTELPKPWENATTKGTEAAQTQDYKRPFGIQSLDSKYMQAVRRLGNVKAHDYSGLDPMQDAYNAVQEYWDTVRASVEATKNNPSGKDPLGVGESRFEKIMRELELRYETNGMDYAGYKDYLSGMGYKSNARQDQENAQRAAKSAATDEKSRLNVLEGDAEEILAKDNPWMAFAKDNAGSLEDYAKFYESLPQITMQVNREENAKNLSTAWQEAWQDFISKEENWWAADYYPDEEMSLEDQQRLQTYGQEQARFIREAQEVYQAAPEVTEDMARVLNQMRGTLEGAQEWAMEAKGTEEEQRAKDNLWFVERKTKYDAIQLKGDYKTKSQPIIEAQRNKGAHGLRYDFINDKGDTRKRVDLASDQNANIGQLLKYQYMTPEEVKIYNYLYAQEDGNAESAEYLDYLNYELDKRANEAFAQKTYAQAKNGGIFDKIGMSIASVPASIGRFWGYADVLGQKLLGGDKPVNTERAAGIGLAAESTRQGVMDSQDWNVNIFGKNVDAFDFLYGTAMSSADSLAAGALGPVGAAALLGGSAAESTMRSAIDSGASEGQALLIGAASGVFESLFESISLGKFFKSSKELGKKGAKAFARDLIAQAGINFSEEFNTEVANFLAEELILGENSQTNQDYQYYLSMGNTEEEAKAKIAKELAFRFGEAGMGGLVQGAGMSTLSSAMSASSTRSANKQMGNGIISAGTKETLKNIAVSMGKETEAGKLGASYSPKSAGDAETGKLYRAVMKQLPQSMRETMRQPIARDLQARMEALGEETGSQSASIGIAKLVNGEKLSEEEMRAIAASKTGIDLTWKLLTDEKELRANEILSGMDKKHREDLMQAWDRMNDGQKVPDWAREELDVLQSQYDAKTLGAYLKTGKMPETINGKEADGTQGNAPESVKEGNEEEIRVNMPMEEKTRQKAQEEEIEGNHREIGIKARIKGESQEASIQSVKVGGNGISEVSLTDGRKVAAADLDMPEDKLTILEETAGMEGKSAESMMKNFQEGENALDYARGFRHIYQAAKAGKSMEEIKSIFGSQLAENQQRAAYEAGIQAAKEEEQGAERSNLESAREAGFKTLQEARENEAGLYFSKVKNQITEEKLKTQLKLIDAFAKETGMQVRLYDSLGQANASYETGSNIVNLAMDAEEGDLTRVMSHESFHYIESWSPEKAGELKSFVLDALGGTEGYSLDNRIQEMQRRYRRNGQELTRDGAISEIVADSVLDVIGTEENLQKLIAKDRTLTEKLQEWARKTAEKLRGLIKRFAKNSPEAQALLEKEGYLEKVSERMKEALKIAKENYTNAQYKATEEAKQDSSVLEYLSAMQGATSQEAAHGALNRLVSGLFSRAEKGWIEKHADIELNEAVKQFAEALKSYMRGEESLSSALKRAGFDEQPYGMNTALSYAGRQLLMAESRGMDVDVKYQIKQANFTDEKIEKNLSYVADMKPVKELIGNEFSVGGKDLVENVGKYFFQLGGNVYNEELGDVELTKKGIKTDIGHGLGRNKAASFKAIDAVIKDGRVIDYEEKWKGRPYDTAVIAAPIKIGEQDFYMGVIVKRSSVQTFYLHEVILQEKSVIGSRSTIATGNAPDFNSGSNHTVNSILEKLNNVNIEKAEISESTEKKFSLKAENIIESVEMDDAELYAQLTRDKNMEAAAKLFDRLRAEVYEEGSAEKGWKSRVSGIADKLLRETGSLYSRNKLLKDLDALYASMNDPRAETGELLVYAKNIGENLLKEAPGRIVDLDESTREALRIIKESRFTLTQEMKSQIREEMGSVAAYARKHGQKMGLRGKANNSLVQVWKELSQILPGTFQESATEADMPIILDAFLETTGEKHFSGSYGANLGQHATDIGLNIILDYFDVPGSLRKATDIRKEYQSKLHAMRKEYEVTYEERMKPMKEREELAQKRNQLRGEIGRTVKYINTRIIHESDTRHVPKAFLGAAERMMQPFLTGTGVFSADQLISLRNEYEKLGETGANHDVEAARAYDQEILDKLDKLESTMKGRSLTELTLDELEDVRDITGNLKKMIVDANEMQVQGRKTTLDAEAGKLLSELSEKKDQKFEKAMNLIYKNTTPVYFGNMAGGVIKEQIGDLMAGQNQWAFWMKNARSSLEKIAEKYSLNEWINDKDVLRFDTQRGETIELDRRMALSIYATWNREIKNKRQNANHLRMGGFMYPEGTKIKGVDTKNPHALTEGDMEKVREYLGKQGMEFADEMVKYLSEDMAKIGNEISMELYGYEKFKESYYFPYESNRDFLRVMLDRAGEAQTSMPKNAKMTRQTVERANNPVVIRDFLEVWANHVNQMGLYGAFAIPIDNLNRIYNYKTAPEAHVNAATGETDIVAPQSVKLELKRAMGSGAEEYLSTLVKDISGGVRANDRTKVGKMMSLFKKGSVAANASVAIQQPSAIARAMVMMNPKYFFGKPTNPKQDIQEMEKYSGIAIIKDMGRFDTATGQSAQEWILDSVKEGNAVKRVYDVMDEWSGKAPEFMDRITWGNLWAAVKREVSATQSDLEAGTEEYFRAVADRFNDVVNHTQVYDSVLSRSQLMRGQSAMDKIVTAFMAEPTVSFNMLAQATLNAGKAGGKRKAIRAAGTFVVATAFNAMLKSLVTMGRRKDDEERTVVEKYLAEFTENFLGDISPEGIISLVPYARDIVSIFQGYDVNRSDMEIISQLKDALDTVKSEKATLEDKMQAIFGAVGNLFGVPIKNVWRDVEGTLAILNSAPISETSARDIKYSVLEALPHGWDKKASVYYERMENALIEGNTKKYEELFGYVKETMGKEEKTIKSGIKSAMKDSVLKGTLEKKKAADILEKNMDLDADKAYFTVEGWMKTASAQDEEYSYSRFDAVMSAVKSNQSATDAIKELTSHGYTEKEVKSEIKGQIREWYLDGEMSRQEAEKRLKKYNSLSDPNDLYFLFKEWDYAKANGGSGEGYGKYDDFFGAVDSGKNLSSVIKSYTDNGVEKETLARMITTQYKEEYVSLYRKNKAEASMLKARLLTAYAALGYSRDKKNKDIDAWLKT